MKLYADDTFLCAQNKDFNLLENEVNLELRKVFDWMSSNKLTLNISKSKYMIVTNKRNVPAISVKINDTELNNVVHTNT